MNMKFDFSGKIVLVTGAATGIGRETALQYAKAGATVLIADFNADAGKKTCEEIKGLGAKSAFYQVNVADENSVQAMAKAVLGEWKYVDILIANAGKSGKTYGNPITNIDNDDMKDLYDVNVIGFTNTVQAFYDMFKERKQGKIVCTSSIAAMLSNIMFPHYSASKVAVWFFVQSMALEMGAFNINVNAIAPGYVYTPIYHEATNLKAVMPERFADCETSEQVMNKMAAHSALHRAQTEEDMAFSIMFLSSDEAENITGQYLNVDSGRLVM